MGGAALAEAALKHFGIGWKETSADGAVTIDPVYCLGFCSVAPAALVNGAPLGRLDAKRLIAKVEEGA
jgi:formate dehydrogenase subunit gamma